MKRLAVIVIATLICMGCSAPIYNSIVKYHHASTNGEAYWMTVMSTKSDSKQVKAGLWYCQAENKNEPVCTQAKLKTCKSATEADCDLTANGIWDVELDSSINHPITKTVVR